MASLAITDPQVKMGSPKEDVTVRNERPEDATLRSTNIKEIYSKAGFLRERTI